MTSAELARVWSHLLGHLVTTNAPPGTLVPLARQTIVLNPTSPDVGRICELLFPDGPGVAKHRCPFSYFLQRREFIKRLSCGTNCWIGNIP